MREIWSRQNYRTISNKDHTEGKFGQKSDCACTIHLVPESSKLLNCWYAPCKLFIKQIVSFTSFNILHFSTRFNNF